jgi:hypothetical protein
MTKYVMTEAAHVEDDIEGLIAAATLGDNLERALTDPTSPMAAMLDRARDLFLLNITLFLDADLHTTDGLELARSQQAEARRYRDMCRWIGDSLEKREEAQDNLADLDVEETISDEMKDAYNGQRAKPAHPDA